MEVSIQITAEEINDAGAWPEFCRMRDLNEWGMSEGLIDPEEKFTLTIKEADDLDLLPLDLEQLID